MPTATLIRLDLAPDGVLLVTAICQTCRSTVRHGAGRDLDAPILGHRTAHCGCEDGYELTDDRRIVPICVRTIRAELAERARRRVEARAARAEAEVDSDT